MSSSSSLLASSLIPNFLKKKSKSALALEASIPDMGEVAVENRTSALPENWHRGAFMQVFVRSYQDSTGNGFGDIRGLISRLDYLHDLGVSGIWLMPIMACADRDHGYAVVDYRSVDPAYGTLADMDDLIREAHARGIGIILDYVPNHSSARHPAFLSARKGKSAPYRDWYVWEEKMPQGWEIYNQNPWYQTGDGCYFAGFWEGMPDYNWHNPEVERFHHNNLRFWLNRGIDGFRFDAVGNLVENGPDKWEAQPENFDIMERMNAVVHAYDNRFMVCEIPRDPYSARSLEACKHTFAFGHQHNILSASKGDTDALQQVADRFGEAPSTLATFLSNHDWFGGRRVYDQLDGDVLAMKLAAAVYMLQPGVPFIYYGEEVGMSGGRGLPEDPSLRTPMSWGVGKGGFTRAKSYRPHAHNHKSHNVYSQHSDPHSLLTHYKWLLRLRRDWRALREGLYEGVQSDGDGALAFRRTCSSANGDAEVVQVVVNVSNKERSVDLGQLPASSELRALCHRRHVGPLHTDSNGHARAVVAARSVMVWGLKYCKKILL